MVTGYPSIDKPWLKYYKSKDIESEVPHLSAFSYLKSQNQDRLSLIALNSMEGRYTYAETLSMIEQTATSLAFIGTGKGNIVLIMLPPISHEVFLFYGIDIVGGAMSFIPPGTTTESICESIIKFSVDFFFIFDSFLTQEMECALYKNTALKNIICIGSSHMQSRDKRTITWKTFIEMGQNLPPIPSLERNPNDLLFIAKTGGTTGTPKEVMLSDNCFNILVHQYLHTELPYDAGDRWLRLWPIFSATAAVSSSHLALCAGMESLLRPFPMKISDFDEMVLAEKPNHLILIPQLLDVLERSTLLEGKDLSFIKSAGCGGLSITRSFEERVSNFFNKYNLPLFLGYGWGCTENSSSAAMRMNLATTKIGFVGIPLVNTVVSIFDPETLVEMTYGEEGELCIQSHTAMIGYYQDPELTSTVLKRHSDGTTWIHTGDLGTVDIDGFVRISGRMTRTIFVFPTAKVYPTDLENTISQIPGVLEVAVVGIPDSEHDGFSMPICFIIKEENYKEESVIKDIDKLCYNLYPEYARPKKIYIRRSFPLTKIGKVDYRALEKDS